MLCTYVLILLQNRQYASCILFILEGILKKKALVERQAARGRFDKARESEKYTPKTNTFASKQLYLDEIGQYPLLTKKEEMALGAKSSAGDFDAIQQLVLHNLRLVVSEAEKFRSKVTQYHASMEDVYQNGNIGLWMAAKAYRPMPSARFATYARKYIRQQIDRGLYREKPGPRIPTGQMETIQAMNRLINEYEQKEGREPTDEEVAEMLQQREMKRAHPHPEQFTVERVKELKTWAMQPTSLEKNIDDGKHSPSDQTSLAELIENKRAETPEAVMTKKVVQEEIEKALNKLSYMDQTIIRKKWLEDSGKTQYVINRRLCKQFNVAVEELPELEQEALAHLGEAFEDIESMKSMFMELLNSQ